ncbi:MULTISPECIES: SPOR domain-containing protein [Pseudomonas]|uniref:SPOR domain-containing protein n=1 Tax=Pseudomonas TaxID=286 RepID=UPI000ED28F00|nr:MULTISPECIES: SPOR domain-containing protein [Pseudomonas]UUW74065.1 SPOR domain-containing protein [Pseudomonas psychrotolerans]WCE10941.1 SPOR domain-containing protein [Pseudomonas sp. JBR1]HAC67164.1 cell division protein [Pseudomonas sp.]
MMAKKAPPKRGASRNTSAPKKQPLPGWVWLASGLAIGAFVVFLMKLEPGNKSVQRAKPEEGRPAATAGNGKSTAAGKTEGTPPTPIKPKYDFYTLLPESEVIVPPDAVPRTPAAKPTTPAKPDAAATPAQPGQPTTATPTTPGTAPGQPAATPPKEATTKAQPPVTLFFLQAGSFRTQADADRVRAQIIMLGQDVRVESGKVKDDTWYRVLVGPYSDRDQLTQAQKQLAGSGFKNLLLQQRRGH